MNRLLPFAGICCLALAGTGGYFALPDPPAPGLYAEQPVISFGEVSQGDVLGARFTLVNHFQNPVTINEVVTGCSCAKVSAPREILPPGEKTELQVAWEIGAKRGPSTDQVGVLFTRPDGVVSFLELQLQADVAPDIRYEPRRLEFAHGRSETLVARFGPGSMSAFSLKKAYTNQKALRAAVSAETSEVRVEYDAAVPVDTGAWLYLSVETDSANEPTLYIPIRVQR